MEENKKKKLIILTISALALLLTVIGVSFAFFRFSLSGENQELVVGDIYMHYRDGTKQINIKEAIPSATYDENEYFEFTIDGKNTYSEKDIWYEIDLVYGDAPADRKTRIRDDLLKFTLFEKIGDDGVDTKVLDGVNYENINNVKIWANKIDKNTTDEVKITYKLYMWISADTSIGDNGDYSVKEWNDNVYASVKVNVKGDFEDKSMEPEGENLIEKIKAKAYSNTSELIALDVTDKTNIKKCTNTETCTGENKKIEYRYSGPTVNNYIYLQDDEGTNELWRIVGIFEDEKVGQYIKIMKNGGIPESYLPETFKGSDGESYTIKRSSEAYRNNGGSKDNNWPTSGLQYYLNIEQDSDGTMGYLSHLSPKIKNKLVEVKYYLGSYTYSTATPKIAYQQERDIESCASEKGPSENSTSSAVEASTGCRVWANNDTTWTGSVSLLYPSDYGLSASETNWGQSMYGTTDSTTGFYDKKIISTSWIYNTINKGWSDYFWLLSPSSTAHNSAAFFGQNGWVGSKWGGIIVLSVDSSASNVWPVLALSSKTTTIDGDGTEGTPYKILADKQSN